MSLSERFAARSEQGNPYGRSSSVAGDGMRLAEKRKQFEAPDEQNFADAEPETPDALFGDYVDANESTPTYDSMIDSMVESREQSTESSVDTSSSRLADLLRRGADGIDSSSERWENTKDRAKKKIRLFGRATLRAATASGEFALGTGMIVANKSVELSDRADAAVLSAVESAKDGVVNTYNTAADKTGDAIMNGMARVEAGMDKAGGKLVGFQEGVKDKLAAYKTGALARRQARRAKWNAAKKAVSNGLDRSAELAMATGAKLEAGMDKVGTSMVNTQETVANKIERTKTSVHITRAAGRAALEAYSASRTAHAEQNKL